MAQLEAKEAEFGQEQDAKQTSQEEQKAQESLVEKKEPVRCPVNFSKLTLGALRKIQYKFRLRMDPADEPLLDRNDLIEAVTRHFMQEMKVDRDEEIGKFLSLKREEARADLGLPVGSRHVRPRANRAARNNNNNNNNGTSQAGGQNNNGQGGQGANNGGGSQPDTATAKTRTVQKSGAGGSLGAAGGKRSAGQQSTTTPVSGGAATDSK